MVVNVSDPWYGFCHLLDEPFPAPPRNRALESHLAGLHFDFDAARVDVALRQSITNIFFDAFVRTTIALRAFPHVRTRGFLLVVPTAAALSSGLLRSA